MIKVWRFARDREGRADAHKRTNCRKVAVSPPALVARDCDCDWLVRAPEGVDPLSVRFLPLLAWYGVALLYGKLFVAMVPSGFRLTCMHVRPMREPAKAKGTHAQRAACSRSNVNPPLSRIGLLVGSSPPLAPPTQPSSAGATRARTGCERLGHAASSNMIDA